MANRFILPFSDIGAGITPSDGAQLFFSDTGLSFAASPRNTFSDQGETTPNANPVIADSKGVFSDIFIAGTYKVVLKDKNGVQIWEADPIFDIISSDTVTNLAALKAVTGQADNESVNVLNHTTEGDGGGGDFRFDAGSSAADDNAKVIQPTIGTGRWLRQDADSKSADVKWYGAVGDNVADDSVPIQAALDANFTIRIPFTTEATRYRLASTVNIEGNKRIESDGAVLIKDHDGIGMLFTGGSDFNYVAGLLSIEASTAQKSDTTANSTSPTAHGVEVRGNRLIVDGDFISNIHKGNGFNLVSDTGNMNRCYLENLRAFGNGVNGINHESTQDDCAVWTVKYYTDGNRQAGVFYNVNWLGRAHYGIIYTEGNCIDATCPAGCDINKIRNSEFFVYSEENVNSAPRSLHIGTACERLIINDTRQSKVLNEGDETCLIYAGGELWAGGQGDEAMHGSLKMADASDTGSKFSDYLIKNSTNAIVAKNRFRGNGTREMWAIDPVDTVGTEHVMSGTAHITRVSVDGTTAPQDLLVQTKTEVNPGINDTYDLGLTLFRWKQGFIKEIILGTAGTTMFSRAGSPEGVVTANVGSFYLRTDGGASTTLYIKETGTGNTGWAAK